MPRKAPHFAHDSEKRLAELFDRYQIAWEYEPVEFSLSWDDTGRIASGFRPDFYLPEHSLFVELTTLRQELVTRKNRKVRLLRALYPELNIKVLYRRDFLSLMSKGRVLDVEQALAILTVRSTVAPSQRSA